MLRIYRRHCTNCPQISERYRPCSCPIYVEGSLAGETVRKALGGHRGAFSKSVSPAL
jgi:hypothetical protein